MTCPLAATATPERRLPAGGAVITCTLLLWSVCPAPSFMRTLPGYRSPGFPHTEEGGSARLTLPRLCARSGRVHVGQCEVYGCLLTPPPPPAHIEAETRDMVVRRRGSRGFLAALIYYTASHHHSLSAGRGEGGSTCMLITWGKVCGPCVWILWGPCVDCCKLARSYCVVV